MIVELARRALRAFLFCAALVAGSSPTTLAAQEAPGRRPSLQWTRSAGAEACIDPQSLAQRVEALTGPRFSTPRDADYSIEAHVEPRAQGFFAELRIAVEGEPPRGLRRLEHDGDDCRGFDQALAFVIALMIDPELDLDGLTDETQPKEPGPALLAELPAPRPTPARVRTTHVVALRAPANAPAPAHTPRFELAGGATLLGGDTPRVSLGGQLALAYHVRRYVALAVSLRGDSGASSIALENGLAMRSSRVSFALLGCTRRPLGMGFHVALCIGPEPELWLAHGLGFIDEARARRWAFGGVLQAEVGYALNTRSAFTLSGLGRVNVVRPTFTYDLVGTSHDALNAGVLRGGAILGVHVVLGSV